MAIECGAARKAARCDVRHRLEADGGETGRGVDLFGERPRRDGADIDRGSGREVGAQRLDIAWRQTGRLERGPRREGRDALLRLRGSGGEDLCSENLSAHDLYPFVTRVGA